MSWLTRIRNVFRARKLSAELDDELRLTLGSALLALTGHAAALLPAQLAARFQPARILQDE
jgi:hypothetical protein